MASTKSRKGAGEVLSPVAMLQRARAFAAAAKALQGTSSIMDVHFPVTHYLYAHSIELGLKAYLCGKGWTETQLRALDYDLEACVSAASKAGLGTTVPLSAEERDAIALVSPLYEARDLEYASSTPDPHGMISVPEPSLLRAAAERLATGLREFCEAKLAVMRTAPAGRAAKGAKPASRGRDSRSGKR